MNKVTWRCCNRCRGWNQRIYTEDLIQKWHNSSALVMELHLPPIKPSIYQYKHIPFTESIIYGHIGPIGVFCRMELNIFSLSGMRN